MTSNYIYRLFTWILPVIILSGLALNSSSPIQVGDSTHSDAIVNTLDNPLSTTNKLPLAVAQNTTDTSSPEDTSVPSTEEPTTNTTTPELPPWNAPLDESLYYPLALIFSILGIGSAIWLVFFVETSKERTVRERIIGSAIRLVVMSLLLGLAIHFWILFEPF